MAWSPDRVREDPSVGLPADKMKGLWVNNGAVDEHGVVERDDVEVLIQYEWEVGYDWDVYVWTVTQAPEDDDEFVATLSSGLNKRALRKRGSWEEVCSFVSEVSKWLWDGDWSDRVSFEGVDSSELKERLLGNR